MSEQQYDNTNRGVLFKNNKKDTDRHPDYTGNINVDGVEFFISSWIKESSKGNKFMSLSVTKKDKQPTQHSVDKQNGYQPQSTGVNPDVEEELDSDIPF